MNTQEKQIDREYDNFTNALIPFGSLDIRTAITTALEVEEDGDWVAELVEEYMESCEVKLSDIDIVYCVYDAILQEARSEIDELIDFDFLNDGADIDTYGNYMATSYNISEGANILIREKLTENEIDFEDLSVKTKWFLKEIEAEY